MMFKLWKHLAVKHSLEKILVVTDQESPKRPGYLRVIALSDTHGIHQDLRLPECQTDIIVHAGDFTNGSVEEVYDFLEWFSELKIKYKILVTGNHEYYIQEQIKQILQEYPNIIFLNNTLVKIENLSIFGTEGFDKTTLNTESLDILVTHYPPFNILDTNRSVSGNNHVILREHNGSEYVNSLLVGKKIGLHIFGHIHESAGMVKINNTLHVNASIFRNRFLSDDESIQFNRINIFDIRPK